MTPADCVRAAHEFEDAYRAFVLQNRNMLAMPDGRLEPIPGGENVVAGAPLTAIRTMTATARSAAEIGVAVRKLARDAAVHFVERKRALFYRLPTSINATCAHSEPDRLPCRAMLTGENRDTVTIQIGVRA